MQKKFIEKIAIIIFENYITCRKKEELIQIRNIWALAWPCLITIVSYIASIRGYDFWISLILLIITIVGYLVLNQAISMIDTDMQNETDELKSRLAIILSEKEALEHRFKKEQSKSIYAQNLYAESMAIQKAIVRANAQNTAGTGLYTTFTQAIITTMDQCFTIPRENYQISIYGYDGTSREVRRLDIESYVKTKQTPSKSRRLSIDDEIVKKYYYVKALTSKKTYFSLQNNEEIRKELYFASTDEELIKQYSQYVGMSCRIDEMRKLYVEIIAFNELRFEDYCDSLGDFIKKIIAPYSTLFASVNWEHVRRDLDA